MQSETINNHAAFIWSVAANLCNHIAEFTKSLRDIVDKFKFGVQIDCCHTAIGGTPISRVHNLCGLYAPKLGRRVLILVTG